MSALQPPVALLLVRKLSALRGYPRLVDGESWFAEKLCEAALSVEHANAIIDKFTGVFPEIGEMRDVADNLRPQFEPPAAPAIEKWLAEGATYDPEWSARLASEYAAGSESFHARHKREWMRVVDAWRAEDLTGRRRREYPPDLRIAQLREHFGFELTLWDQQVLEAAGKRTEAA